MYSYHLRGFGTPEVGRSGWFRCQNRFQHSGPTPVVIQRPRGYGGGRPGPRYSIHYCCEELWATSTATSDLVTRRDPQFDHCRETACHHSRRLYPDGASEVRGPRYRCFDDQENGRDKVRGRRRSSG
jgi:hypothetical protein